MNQISGEKDIDLDLNLIGKVNDAIDDEDMNGGLPKEKDSNADYLHLTNESNDQYNGLF